MASVYVVGDNIQVSKMFSEQKFIIVPSPKKADIIVFPGGSDINPGFYGQKPIQGVSAHRFIDERDYAIWNNHKEDSDKFFVGICRGGQFLNVMNGGLLWQHVNNHTLGSKTHDMIDTLTDDTIRVTSTHHQMMRPTQVGEILGIAYESSHWVDEKIDIQSNGTSKKHRENQPTVPPYDVEIVWYKNTKCLCYQPHPEYSGPTRQHFFELFKKLYR